MADDPKHAEPMVPGSATGAGVRALMLMGAERMEGKRVKRAAASVRVEICMVLVRRSVIGCRRRSIEIEI